MIWRKEKCIAHSKFEFAAHKVKLCKNSAIL